MPRHCAGRARSPATVFTRTRPPLACGPVAQAVALLQQLNDSERDRLLAQLPPLLATVLRNRLRQGPGSF